MHTHVSRHAEDDDIQAFDSRYQALDYAATELDRLADFEHDCITTSGEAGMFEDAYRAFVKCHRHNGLHMNAANIVKQHGAERPEDRAPLYRGDDWQDLLSVAADHVISEIVNGSPFTIWQCSELECAPEDDE